jgi:hypothetical protein
MNKAHTMRGEVQRTTPRIKQAKAWLAHINTFFNQDTGPSLLLTTQAHLV